jgi:hypothetical protein
MKPHKTFCSTASLLALSLTFTLVGYWPAMAGPLIYSTADNGTLLVTIDFGTGETTLIGPTMQPLALGLAYDGSTLFTCTHGMDTSGLSQLARIDPTTGTATAYGMTNSLEFMGLVVTPDGILYGASSTDGNLYTIDLNTGAPTMVGPLGPGGMMGGTGGMMGGMGGIMGLAMHPNGTLYGLDATGTLFQIDLKTAHATQVLTVSGLAYPMGLGIDGDGNGYTVDLLTQATVYQFDLSTGQVTATVQTTLNFLHSALIMGTPRPRVNAPRLNAARQGGQLVFSWSSSFSNCVLQAADHFSPSASWSDWTTAPVLSGDLYTVTNGFLDPQRFFQLMQH